MKSHQKKSYQSIVMLTSCTNWKPSTGMLPQRTSRICTSEGLNLIRRPPSTGLVNAYYFMFFFYSKKLPLTSWEFSASGSLAAEVLESCNWELL